MEVWRAQRALAELKKAGRTAQGVLPWRATDSAPSRSPLKRTKRRSPPHQQTRDHNPNLPPLKATGQFADSRTWPTSTSPACRARCAAAGRAGSRARARPLVVVVVFLSFALALCGRRRASAASRDRRVTTPCSRAPPSRRPRSRRSSSPSRPPSIQVCVLRLCMCV